MFTRNFYKSFIHQILITFFLLSNNINAFAWDAEYQLPPLNAYPADQGNIWSVSYSSQTGDIPISPLTQGQTLRLRVVIPPGASSVSIRAESNQWQGPTPGSFPVMDTFSYNPGEFCSSDSTALTSKNGTACNDVPGTYVYPDQLQPAGGGLNDSLYGDGSPSFPAAEQESNAYFVLYHPRGAALPFQFESLHFTFLIANMDKYLAWLTGSPSIPNVPLAPQFSSTLESGNATSGFTYRLDSSASTGNIISYAWSANSGNIATPANAVTLATFPAGGSYQVTLRISDGSSNLSVTQTINTPAANSPLAAFSITEPVTLTGVAPLTVKVDASQSQAGTAGNQLTYQWGSSDGSAMTAGVVSSVTYKAAGTYTITLTVSDADGTNTTTRQITVTPPVVSVSPAFNVTPNREILLGETVSLDASASVVAADKFIQEYRWRITQAGVDTAAPFNLSPAAHQEKMTLDFSATGTYYVTLEVRDNGVDGGAWYVSDTRVIQVVRTLPPVAQFAALANNLTVNLDASGAYDQDPVGTGIQRYLWRWSSAEARPDNGLLLAGQIAEGKVSQVTFHKAGVYSITLEVIDDEGSHATRTRQVTLGYPALPGTNEIPYVDPPVNSTFSGGVQLLLSGEFLANGAPISQNALVNISGAIQVAQEHQGQAADIIIAVEHTDANGSKRFHNKIDYGFIFPSFAEWNVNIATLEKAFSVGALPARLDLPVYTGKLSNAQGSYNIFFGYRLQNKIVHSVQPIHFRVTP